jgi:agmatinase
METQVMNARPYAGVDAKFGEYETAKAVILQVPYDGTSTWGKGADAGPSALLEATENMELYDIETGTEVYREGIHVAPAITEDQSPELMVEAVGSVVMQTLQDRKIPVVLGGEHSVSIGAIQACAKVHPELTILHIDAHADLRKSYQGSTCNHACAVHWASQNCRLVQVGIRSMDESERAYVQKGRMFNGDYCHYTPDETWQSEVLEALGAEGRPLYITVDLDAFDPAFLPDTGTPEPGGLNWFQVTRLIRLACEKFNVVGFDVVELAAHERSKPSDFLAAKLVYKMLTYALQPAAI